jgi:hypothetical protein
VRWSEPRPGCGGGLHAIGVMEDSEPASMAIGISYAMRAGYAVVYTKVLSKVVQSFQVVVQV